MKLRVRTGLHDVVPVHEGITRTDSGVGFQNGGDDVISGDSSDE